VFAVNPTSGSGHVLTHGNHHRKDEGSVSPPLHRDCNEWQQLKRARLTTSLNHRLVTRPGPLELIQGNILPGSAQLQQALQKGSIQFRRTKEGISCSSPGCDSTASTTKSAALMGDQLPWSNALSFDTTASPAAAVSVAVTTLPSHITGPNLSTTPSAPAITKSPPSSSSPLTFTSSSSSSLSSSSSSSSACHTQSPLFSPLNLDLSIDLEHGRSFNSPIYAIGCPSPLLQRIPITLPAPSNGPDTSSQSATMATTVPLSAPPAASSQNSANPTQSLSIGSNPSLTTSRPLLSTTPMLTGGSSMLPASASLLQRGLRPHQLPSTVQFHLQQNQYRHAQMLNNSSNSAAALNPSRQMDSRCATMRCAASGPLLSRSKKNKCKSQPKAKTIKFHEYKGPPNAPPPKSPSSLVTIESNESSYELLLKQQQLFLQWQLELQHKGSVSPCQQNAVRVYCTQTRLNLFKADF
jgi:hypothetical protein